jgi:hypothetical protein
VSAVDATSEQALDLGRRLMAFNWLTAAYAHRDWLGPWADILEPRPKASIRLIRRASIVLLDRLSLRQRFARELRDDAWVIEPRERIHEFATALGTAMLGGWVRNRIERAEVALQVRVLGAAGRDRALEHAHRLTALPFPLSGKWPMALSGPSAPFRLGVSCLAYLLESENSGMRDRFLLRFPAGTVTTLLLSPRQRDEALSIIHGHETAAAGT